MNFHESDYDRYHKKKMKILIPVSVIAVLALIIYLAGPVAKSIKTGAPGLYDIIRRTSGADAVEYYTNEVKEELEGEAEILNYAITPNMRPVYHGDTLTVDDKTGRISSTNGKFTNSFRSVIKGSTTKQYLMNADSSEVAVMVGSTLFHIDDQLNITTVAEGVYSYRLCHDGGVMCYITNDDYKLYVYDIASGESTLVDDPVFTMEISPNGQYCLYQRNGIDSRYIAIANIGNTKGAEDSDKLIISYELDNVMPMFVSVDGRTAYYYTYQGYNDKYTKPSVYCFHEGKETRVYDDVHPVYYTNVSAEELFFFDDKADKVIYYNPAMTGGACLFETDYARIKPAFTYSENNRKITVDSNNIRDGVLFSKP